MPARARPRARAATPGGKLSVGRSRTPGAVHRHKQRQAQRDHARGGAPGQHQPRPVRDGSRTGRAAPRPRSGRTAGRRTITTRLDSSGASAGQREPVVGLQHAGEHDSDPVQHHLRGEHHQHPGGERGTAGAVRRRAPPGTAARPGGPPGALSGSSTARVQPSSAEAIRSRLLAPAPGQRPGQQRHHRPGQRAAGDHLEQHVRQLVGAWCRRHRCSRWTRSARTPAPGRSRPPGPAR